MGYSLLPAYISVCMHGCVCVHARASVCLYLPACARVCVGGGVWVFIIFYLSVSVSVSVYMCVCLYACTCVCVCVCVCVCMYLNVYKPLFVWGCQRIQ